MVLFEALAYIIYVREGYYFSLVCTFKKVINNFILKVDVQKRTVGFRKKRATYVLVSSNSRFHSLW